MFLHNQIKLALLLLALLSTPALVSAAGPMIQAGITKKLTDNVYIIPDQRVNLVPNVGIIIGEDSVMVIDTGMGPRNARTVLAEVSKITDKPVSFLGITHFHPEHGMGAQSFLPATRIIVPQAQKKELDDKGEAYIELFKGFSQDIAQLLDEVTLVSPHMTFEKQLDIDLGGITVRLLHFHAAHTRGDMFVYIPEQEILFGGDIVLNRFFPIMPDPDSSAHGWIKSLEQLKALNAKIIVPGHGAVGDVALIDNMSGFLLQLKKRVSDLKANQKSLEDIQAELVPEFTKKYSNWDNPNWIQNASERFYSEL